MAIRTPTPVLPLPVLCFGAGSPKKCNKYTFHYPNKKNALKALIFKLKCIVLSLKDLCDELILAGKLQLKKLQKKKPEKKNPGFDGA